MDTTNIKNRIYLVLGSLVIILIIVSFFYSDLFISKKIDNSAQKQQNDLLVIQSIQEGALNDDTDGDGLKNWEEVLMKTNPNVKDNPNQNTNNEIEETSVVVLAKDDPLNDPNNLTAQFAKNAYTLAGYLESKGVSDDQTIKEVSKGLVDGEIAKLLIKRYSEGDLNITTKGDNVTLKNYGNQLAGFIDTSFKVALAINEEEILNTYNTSKNVSDLNKLKTKIDSLTTLQNNLKGMTVPRLAVNNHLDILNRTNSYTTVLKNIYTAPTDPMRAIAGYTASKQTFQYFIDSAYGFVDFFKSNKVVFGKNEKGDLFNFDATNIK